MRRRFDDVHVGGPPRPPFLDLHVGTIVHYVGSGQTCQAAIVVEIMNREDGVVCLQLFAAYALEPAVMYESNVMFSYTKNEKFTWHWMEH
jgi:hypothetical protein